MVGCRALSYNIYLIEHDFGVNEFHILHGLRYLERTHVHRHRRTALFAVVSAVETNDVCVTDMFARVATGAVTRLARRIFNCDDIGRV